MGDSKPTDAFWPKQIIRVTPETIREVVRDGGERIAAASLESVLPVPAGAVIHDNGCGAGAATSVIMASLPPEVAATVKITGTDLDETALEAYRTRAEASSWPAEGLVMDAAELSFPDETFTHSVANAVIFLTPNDGVDAVREMRRTLKPGGTLMVNCFAASTALIAVRAASRATRSGGILPAWDSFERWHDPAVIAGVLEAAGFDKGSIQVRQRPVIQNVGDFERHAALTWSFRGMPSAGWSVEDEEKWDEAMAIVRQELRKAEGFQILEDGNTLTRSLMHVAIATK